MKILPKTWLAVWSPFPATQPEEAFDDLFLELEDLFIKEKLHSSAEEIRLSWITYYSIFCHIDLPRVPDYA